MKVLNDIVVQSHISLISLSNITNDFDTISELFLSLAHHNVNLDLITQTYPLRGQLQISFTVDDNDLFETMNNIKAIMSQNRSLVIDVNSNQSKIILKGHALGTTPGIAALVLKIIQSKNITVSMISTSEDSITLLTKSSDLSLVEDLYTQLRN